MKNTIKTLVILLLAFTFNACDDVEKLADVELSTTLIEKIPIHFNENMDQEAIEQQLVIGLDNADTHDYLNKIKEVSVKKLTYKIIDLTGGDDTSYMMGSFFINTLELKHNLEMDIIEDFNDETIFEVTDVTKLNQIGYAIKTNKQITAKLIGNYQTYATTNFKIEIRIELAIVANPL